MILHMQSLWQENDSPTFLQFFKLFHLTPMLRTQMRIFGGNKVSCHLFITGLIENKTGKD